MRGGSLNKGFIKTPEAIIAALLVFAMLSYLSEKAYAPTINADRDLSLVEDSILDLLGSEIRNNLESCDFRRIQYLVRSFQPANTESRMIIEQVTEILAEPEIPIESQVLSFTYNFPTYVDKNSVIVYSEEQEYLTNAKWVWFSTPIIIFNNLSDKVDYDLLFENVKLNKQGVVNDSLVFYWNQKQVPINLSGFLDDLTYSLANISVRIPSISGGESGTAHLLFAVNNTTFTQSYANISGLKEGFNYTVMDTIETDRADVIFRMLNLTEDTRLYLSYSIGTNTNLSYFGIGEDVNNSYVSFTIYRDGLKLCTPLSFERAPTSRFFAVRKSLYNNRLSSIIELQMWYQWA